MTNIASDVLIVGAGPTGLTLACTLAQRGMRVRIVDAASGPATGSRGKGLQPRTLELFDDLGVLDGALAYGIFGLAVRHYDESGHFQDASLNEQGLPRPDAPFLQTLITPQWRVEETLREKLGQLGVHVEFGVEFTGFSQDEEGVIAQLAGADTTSLRVRWLVGCDGGRSRVRQLTQIAFLGETLETYRMLVGDFQVEGIDRDHWHIWKSAEGFLALCPLPSTDLFQLQASIAPGQESEASRDVFQRAVHRRTGDSRIRLSESKWMSLWRANVRMVDRYRQKRVFLAGDAAHVHSPAGGQGMNTGIQDAYNLGWKLAAVHSGVNVALLDTYQEERLPIAAGVIGISNEIMAATLAAGTIQFRRDERTLQLDLNYRNSKLTREMRPAIDGLRAGDRAPDAPGMIGPFGSCRMFDLLRGPHVTLLGFGAHWQPVIDECAAAFKGSLQGYVILPRSKTGGDGPGQYIDAEEHALRSYGEGSLYIVRPDNYIGMATLHPNPAEVMDYLTTVIGRL